VQPECFQPAKFAKFLVYCFRNYSFHLIWTCYFSLTHFGHFVFETFRSFASQLYQNSPKTFYSFVYISDRNDKIFFGHCKNASVCGRKGTDFHDIVIGPSRKEAITAVNIALQSLQFLNFERLLRKVSELQLFREKSLWKVLNSCIGLYWCNHLPVWMRFFLVVYFPIWKRKEISKVVLLWSVLSWVVWWKWYLENCWLSTLELVFPVH